MAGIGLCRTRPSRPRRVNRLCTSSFHPDLARVPSQSSKTIDLLYGWIYYKEGLKRPIPRLKFWVDTNREPHFRCDSKQVLRTGQ